MQLHWRPEGIMLCPTEYEEFLLLREVTEESNFDLLFQKDLFKTIFWHWIERKDVVRVNQYRKKFRATNESADE